MKLNSRRKPIDPITPTSVSTMTEDAVNPDNHGLYQILTDKNLYCVYNDQRKEVSVMEFKGDRERVVNVVRNVDDKVWEFIASITKQVIADDDHDTPTVR